MDITLNYLRMILHYIQHSNTGVLVHCISGWDRTPLFISLIRMSLWADGVIHQSLNATQMLYFTIAYDWYMFGHNLPDRLAKGEDIFFFCFSMLKNIVNREFCTIQPRFVFFCYQIQILFIYSIFIFTDKDRKIIAAVAAAA